MYEIQLIKKPFIVDYMKQQQEGKESYMFDKSIAYYTQL